MITVKLKKNEPNSVFPGLTQNLYVPDYEFNFALKKKKAQENSLKKVLILIQVY